MEFACYEMDISTQWEHDPAISDRYGMTVAMYLAKRGKLIPTQWKHDPTLLDKNKMTVAMYLVRNGREVPPFWNLTKSEFERLYKSK